MGSRKWISPGIILGGFIIYVVYTLNQPSFSITFENVLKGPLPQDNQHLVKFIKDNFIYSPPPSDVEYHFRTVQSAYSQQLDGQFNQAKNISNLLENMRNGFFIECGAADGETFSNSLLFEMRLGWKGLLIEANPYTFSEMMTKNRKAYSINACLSPGPYPQQIQFEALENTLLSGLRMDGEGPGDKWKKEGDRKVKGLMTAQCFPLFSILLAIGNPTVHYFSLDVEGVELDVLKSLPWDKVDIKVLTVEFTHIDWQAVKKLLEKNGYNFIYTVGEDMVFVKNGFKIN